MAATISHDTSSSTSRCRYNVFLSFRGDTWKSFADHPFTALKQAGFHSFRDVEEIERGEHIELEIRGAIEESQSSIIVFSENYPSSLRYCLDEIVMILERRNNVQHIVLPVLYDVDPTQVSEQTNEYAKAFAVHEVLLMHEMERLNGWKKAIKEVADMGGMVLADRNPKLLV